MVGICRDSCFYLFGELIYSIPRLLFQDGVCNIFFCWMKVQLIRVAKPGLWYLPPCLRALRHAHKWSNTAQEVTYHHISSLLVVSQTRMAKTKTVETCWNHETRSLSGFKPNGWLCHTMQVSILHQPVMISFAHRNDNHFRTGSSTWTSRSHDEIYELRAGHRATSLLQDLPVSYMLFQSSYSGVNLVREWCICKNPIPSSSSSSSSSSAERKKTKYMTWKRVVGAMPLDCNDDPHLGAFRLAICSNQNCTIRASLENNLLLPAILNKFCSRYHDTFTKFNIKHAKCCQQSTLCDISASITHELLHQSA